MAQFHETVMGQKFYTADVPRLLKTLERIAAALESSGTDKALEKIAAEVAEVARTARADGDDPVNVAQYREQQDAEEDCAMCGDLLVDEPADHTNDGEPVCGECAGEPEKKCGENICCDEPDCAERKNKAEARSIAKQNYTNDGNIDVEEDAEVSLSLDEEGNVQGAYVQGWLWVEFTANKGGK